jgi:putative aldouronate transport system permease protein
MVLLGLFAVVTFFPFYYVVAVSFASNAEYLRTGGKLLVPREFSLFAYRYILSARSFMTSIRVSATIAVVGTLLSLLVTAALAYALSNKRMVARKTLLVMVMISIYFQPGIIPHYLVVRGLGLINTLWSIILTGITTGWYILLMKGFFDSIPDSMVESAYIDGANDAVIWIRIILPLSKASLAAFGLFYAVLHWNTFFKAIIYITDPKKWPIQVLLRNLLLQADSGLAEAGLDRDVSQLFPETVKMAAVVVASIPIIMVYPFLQKHFAKGVMIGSVKG